MNKLKATVLIYVLCNVTGCFVITDDCYDLGFCSDEKVPAYANESGVMVELVATQTSRNYAKLIDDGDTLHSSYYLKENSAEWNIPYTYDCGIVNNCYNPIRMELHFLDNPEKCLIFDGSIEHNGIDMRSWESYKKGKKIPGWSDDADITGIEYIYTITPQHRAMAKEEFCH
jgi:hypothetical protein